MMGVPASCDRCNICDRADDEYGNGTNRREANKDPMEVYDLVPDYNDIEVNDIELYTVEIQRIISALKIYSTLDIINDKQDQNQFEHFIDSIKPTLLDDITYLVTECRDYIFEINRLILNDPEFDDCDISTCKFI